MSVPEGGTCADVGRPLQNRFDSESLGYQCRSNAALQVPDRDPG